MSDLLIRQTGGQWDLVVEDGDAVLTSDRTKVTRVEEVGQRAVFSVSIWQRESVYDRGKGTPYPDGIFGDEPVEGVVSILTQYLLETTGVDGIDGQPTYELADDENGNGELVIGATLVAGDEVFDFRLPVSSQLGVS